jgi:Asp-tRNA(Asn)/Glu-tRNA(Gln) amidotransferase A subunit family amidase
MISIKSIAFIDDQPAGGEVPVRPGWNLEEPSGGSSAGPASATAAGLSAFSIGTDSLGSILEPADRCGIVGMRMGSSSRQPSPRR